MSTRNGTGGTRLPATGGGGGTTLTDLGLDLDLETFTLPANVAMTGFGRNLVMDNDAADARSTIGVRKEPEVTRIDAVHSLVDNTTDQPVFPAGQNALTVVAGMTYHFECLYMFSKGSTSANFRPILNSGGTATFTSAAFRAEGFIVLNPNILTAPGNSVHTQATVPVNVVANGAALNQTIRLVGDFEINAGGTLIPGVNLSLATGATPTVLVGSFFKVWEIGINPFTKTAGWS